MTAHKHAENMRLYAEDAAETDKPWERWEYKPDYGVWASLDSHPDWFIDWQYRRKEPATKVVTFECWCADGLLMWMKRNTVLTLPSWTRIPALDKTAEVPA